MKDNIGISVGFVPSPSAGLFRFMAGFKLNHHFSSPLIQCWAFLMALRHL